MEITIAYNSYKAKQRKRVRIPPQELPKKFQVILRALNLPVTSIFKDADSDSGYELRVRFDPLYPKDLSALGKKGFIVDVDPRTDDYVITDEEEPF